MSQLSPIKLLTLLVVSVLLVLLLIAGILLTDTLLNIRQNLEQSPAWVFYLVILVFGLFSIVSGWLIFRLLLPKKVAKPTAASFKPVDEESLNEKLEQFKSTGIDTTEAERELEKLNKRREAGIIHIALFGEISSGKSSLIKSLLPGAEVDIAVTGGTTRQLKEYVWTSPAGDQLILTDMPGLNETGIDKNALSRQEALRSHLVLYICDSDLAQSQLEELTTLSELKKPIILVLNKTDRLTQQDIELLETNLQSRSKQLGNCSVVTVSSGGSQQVTRINTDGSEETIRRQLPARVDDLKIALQRAIDGNNQTLEKLRDSAVFTLVSSQLDEAQELQRDQQALELTRSYSKKAVVAAIAAFTPGTDILIQGYLATQMVKDLAELYEVPVRKVDVDLLLKLVQKHVRTHITLLLAVAGNALKAFPGVGTLAGGLLHAIAYGFLFETLGKSLAKSLKSRGELHPLQVASQFEENLGENIKASAGFYTRLALQEINRTERKQKS